MKKLSLALATVGLTASLGAFAAIPTDAQPFQLVVPCLQSGIEFTLEGLIFAPDVNNLAYGNVASATTTATATSATLNASNTIANQSPNLDMLGFRAAVGYIFPNSGNDVQLSWTQMFNDNDSTSTTLAPGQSFVTESGAVISILPVPDRVGATSNQAIALNSYSQTKYGAIDLDVGQYLDVGTRLRMRFFGGLRAAQVENNVSDTYTDTAIQTLPPIREPLPTQVRAFSFTEFDQLNSKYAGIGPRFGVDSDYHIMNCFGIAGHFAGALLVGTETASTTNNFTNLDQETGRRGDITTIAGTQSFSTTEANNPTRIVPAFDAKLGLDYSYIFADHSILSVEAGYQVTEYINALDKIHNTYTFPVGGPAGGTPAPFAGAGAQVGQSITTSSIGFDGPYLSLNYKV